MWMGVVADDITGSNDIGIMFAKSGLRVHVYSFPTNEENTLQAARHLDLTSSDIVILDTNSRLDDRETAYQKVYAATQVLQDAGCPRFFNKTCSVFRGNIGAEFDAMLDALGAEFGVVVLGFPKNGRITREAVHYVRGQRLEDSEFRNDPIHPMKISNLVDILQAQTHRTVRSLDYRAVSLGPEALKERIGQMRAGGGYLILDVTSQEDLRTIAAAIPDELVLCGSSALAEELPSVWGDFSRPEEQTGLHDRHGMGVLCVAGSLMPQTFAQVDHMRVAGAAMYELDTLHLYNEVERKEEIQSLVKRIAADLGSGRDVVLHSPNGAAAVERTRAAGRRQGLDKTSVARLVSDTLAEVTAQLVERCALNRLVVAGGETSAAVCDRLGITGVRVWKEIQAGLPSCLSLAGPPMLLVLKSGSFGTPTFLEEAIDHLKAEK